jgi:hypothetical protein
MENQNDINPGQNAPKDQPFQSKLDQEETQFENPDVDPGFEPSDNKLTGREDKRTGNIDSNKSISEMREEFDQKQDDATNLGNDRENGSYNPKNI